MQNHMWFDWFLLLLFICLLTLLSNLFQGDILFLHMSKDPIRAGEIVVYNVDVCSLLFDSSFT